MENGQLKDKAAIWQSTDEWNITTKGEFVYIEKISIFESTITENQENDNALRSLETETGKIVLGNTFGTGNSVVEENFQDTPGPGQLWKKGDVNTEGYFTLVNSDKEHKSPQFLTAIGASELEIKGTHF